MTYKLITDVNAIDKTALDQFIFSHPSGNIYQTSHMFKVYKETKNYEPLIIASLNDKTITGILLAVIIKQAGDPIGSFTSRSIITGGPLVKNDDPEILTGILSAYKKIIGKKAIYSEIREIFKQPDPQLLVEYGFSIEDRLNIIVDLKQDEETLWNQVSSKRKNEIRRSVKEGTVVREISERDNIEKSYRILKDVYSRARLPFAHQSLFVNCFNLLLPANLLKCFGAFNKDELIGTMYVLCYKDRAIDWYAGSMKEYYNKYPNDIIPWEAFKLLKKDGFRTFDFGGAGRPGIPYGVRDYKKKFGGEFIELKRFKLVHKPFLMNSGKQGLKLIQKFR